MKHSILKGLTTPILKCSAGLGNTINQDRTKSPIIITGSPRGGTTWVAEAIAKAVKSEWLLWEPLQDGNPEKPDGAFSKRPYLDEDTVTTSQKRFFTSLLSGKQANAHLLRLRKNPEAFISLFRNQQMVVKFVRGNGVVGWLRRQFDIPKPLVVIRHPCAVVASQMKMGTWEDHPHVDPGLLRRRPEIHEVVDYDASLLCRLAMTWAADVLAAKESKTDLNFVYYEDIVMNGANSLEKTLVDWGWEGLGSDLDHILLAPSSTTHNWSTLQDAESAVKRWENDLSSNEIDLIINIVERMGVHDYGTSPFPISRV